MRARNASRGRITGWVGASSAAFVVAGLLVGCSPDKLSENLTQGPPPPVKAAPDAGAKAAPPPVVKVEFTENDFVEGDRNRDPFRSYASLFSPQENRHVAHNQRTVVLGDYSLDELKLVAIVMGGDYPRAMVVDPNKKGWVIKRGDFVGRPEVVHTGGANGVDYQLNWRVDKVRDGEVVFTREDAAQPGIPPATRVMPIRTDAEEKAFRL